MRKILSFLAVFGKREEALEDRVLSNQRINYLHQKIGTELYNVADRMPVGDVLAALDRIRADVERHAATGGRIV